jgi:hypothetical protein
MPRFEMVSNVLSSIRIGRDYLRTEYTIGKAELKFQQG